MLRSWYIDQQYIWQMKSNNYIINNIYSGHLHPNLALRYFLHVIFSEVFSVNVTTLPLFRCMYNVYTFAFAKFLPESCIANRCRWPTTAIKKMYNHDKRERSCLTAVACSNMIKFAWLRDELCRILSKRMRHYPAWRQFIVVQWEIASNWHKEECNKKRKWRICG